MYRDLAAITIAVILGVTLKPAAAALFLAGYGLGVLVRFVGKRYARALSVEAPQHVGQNRAKPRFGTGPIHGAPVRSRRGPWG